MLRSALSRAAETASAATGRGAVVQSVRRRRLAAASSSCPGAGIARFFGTNVSGSQDGGYSNEKLALDAIRYTLAYTKAQKSSDSYGHALLLLEQMLFNITKGETEGDNAIGMVSLAMSTLHYRRGEKQDAVEKLKMVHKLGHVSSSLRVAASEALVGLNLKAGQDDTSSLLADDCLDLLRTCRVDTGPASEVFVLRAKSIKGLADIVKGDIGSAHLSFDGSQDYNIECSEDQLGNATLSHGELFHCTGNFPSAKNLYEKALSTSQRSDAPGSSYLSAANMDPEEVVLGATCALGQLLSHSGKFEEAEELLTKALTKAEDIFGSSHPKVGAVLTCIAMMYKHKAKMEASSSILIQEGLYRRAMDYMKAPALDVTDEEMQVDGRDIIALARGGYAELLSIQQSRKEEGERTRRWAEAKWRNQRLSLAQALDFSEPSNAAVVDTRICRVL